MHNEIERKFLIEDWGKILKNKYKFYNIKQAYISDNVRVRIKTCCMDSVLDRECSLTIKSAITGISRKEFEFKILEEEADKLMSEYMHQFIEKIRYTFFYKDKFWEVDNFQDKNKGLLIAEIELNSEDEEFELPPGLGKEVTDDERYYNFYLAKKPYSEWRDSERR